MKERANSLLSIFVSLKKTPPESWYTVEDLQNVEVELCNFLFGVGPASVQPTTAIALHSSLQHLLIPIPRTTAREEVEKLSYVLAWNKSDLLEGVPVQGWKGSATHEWAVHEVVSVSVVDANMPIAIQDYKVSTRILSGSACGSLSEKVFSRKSLVYLAPKMGFSKKPSDKQPWKISPHPRFLSVENLLDLRWYGMLKPGDEYPPKYFELKCTSPILKYNRDVIRRARHGRRS